MEARGTRARRGSGRADPPTASGVACFACSDVSVVQGQTGYTAVMNSCKPISSSDPLICQNGTLACQKATSSGAAYKVMARRIANSTYSGAFGWQLAPQMVWAEIFRQGHG